MTSHIELQAVYRAEIARLRQERDEYRLVTQTEAAERRRAHERIVELEAGKAVLCEALKQVAEHPEEYRDAERSYAVGWAFWNVQRIARQALKLGV